MVMDDNFGSLKTNGIRCEMREKFLGKEIELIINQEEVEWSAKKNFDIQVDDQRIETDKKINKAN